MSPADPLGRSKRYRGELPAPGRGSSYDPWCDQLAGRDPGWPARALSVWSLGDEVQIMSPPPDATPTHLKADVEELVLRIGKLVAELSEHDMPDIIGKIDKLVDV